MYRTLGSSLLLSLLASTDCSDVPGEGNVRFLLGKEVLAWGNSSSERLEMTFCGS